VPVLVAAVILLGTAAVPAGGAPLSTGSITVSSFPADAAVTLDGVYRGQTPSGGEALAIAGLAVGPHQLVLTKSGFIDSHHAVWLGAGEDKSVRVTLIPTSVDAGSVSVVSAPSGADVRIDGAYRGRTPIAVSGLEPGPHQVDLDLAGFVPYTTTVGIRDGVMVYLDPALTAAGTTGFIAVDSFPDRAYVFVDGVYRGTTPASFPATAGSRRLELHRAEFVDWSGIVRVEEGATATVNASLQPLLDSLDGGLAVSSDPGGATVYLDEAERGVTPASGDLELGGVPVGRHTLVVSLEGHADYTSTVQVAQGATARVHARLTATGSPSTSPTPASERRGTLVISSDPEGAGVSLDGQFKGRTPLTINDVPAGAHTVRFDLPGYIEREQGVEVRAGEVASVHANLTATGGEAGAPALMVLAALGVTACAGAISRGRGRR